MIKYILMAIFSIGITGLQAQTKSLHDFQATTIDGKTLDFSTFKGTKVLIVNTASKCGFTPQYEDLQKLYEEYSPMHFTIIGFPANNFLRQEPGTNDEIQEFCRVNYGVTFQMMEKISVKGNDMHPIYKWLTQKTENGVLDAPVKWNFQKFMIDEEGHLVDYASPKTKPFDPKITNWITG